MRRLVAGGFTAALVSALAVVSMPAGAGASDPGSTKSAPATKASSVGSSRQAGTDPATARDNARETARKLVATPPAYLHASVHDEFRADSVISSQGLQYVPYGRTYRGLPVVGGDFVVVTDSAGRLLTTSVAQSEAVALASVTPQVTESAAREAALREVTDGRYDGGTQLVVLHRATSRLAWETTVVGTRDGEPSRLSVYVDARSGRVLDRVEHVVEGTGTGAWEGSVTIPTSGSGTSYSMTNTNAATLKCQDAATNATFTGTDNVWGNGVATDKETGCVDAFYATEQERQMLSTWLGRSGMDGSGGWVPTRVGLADVNAYYDGTQVQIGHRSGTNEWIGATDVVAHEYGHGVDDRTPGGISGNGTQEFVADTFGTATEFYANNPADPADYTIGEEVNLTGSGPIRDMSNPGSVGDPSCYSSSIPTAEVHAAAGPGDHWWYLLANGGTSKCNGQVVTGLGVQKAQTIMYNAMLMKTTASSYLKYRTWTLTAAKNLYPGSCTEFNAVKAAWDAVNVPAQTGDPTCSTGTGCSGQKIVNPGFESGATAWSSSAGVITTDPGQAAHAGSYKAWLDGYGTTHTDTLSQSVTIPAGCTATLSFWIHIDTAETTTTTAYDKLTVKAGTTTLATYSNLNKVTGYVQKSFNVSSLAGQTVSISFSGTEDSSLQTSFVVDDTALTLG